MREEPIFGGLFSHFRWMMRETGLPGKAEGLPAARRHESPLTALSQRKRSDGIGSVLEKRRKGRGRP